MTVPRYFRYSCSKHAGDSKLLIQEYSGHQNGGTLIKSSMLKITGPINSFARSLKAKTLLADDRLARQQGNVLSCHVGSLLERHSHQQANWRHSNFLFDNSLSQWPVMALVINCTTRLGLELAVKRREMIYN